MKRLILAMTVAAFAPAAATAASYYALTIDKKTLVMTDLKTPRQTATGAEAYEFIVNRAPVKAGKAPADFVINKIEINCAAGKTRQFYSASYSATGAFATSKPTPGPWSKVKPGSVMEPIANLGCHGLPPRGVVPIGDVLMGKIIATYRAGGYDRFIK